MLNFDNFHTVFFEQGKVDILQARWTMYWRMLELKNYLEQMILWGAPRA